MNEIIELDKQLFLFLNGLGQPMWDGFWSFISEKFYWIPLYIVLLYIIFKKFGFKKTLLIVILTTLMVLVTDQITNVFKATFQRLRPCHVEEFGDIMRKVACEGRGRYGFTSAHASNHFAVAIFLGLLLKPYYKWMLTALLVWAAFISYSRIYLGVHFPLDVICGGIMGVFIGYLFFKLYIWINQKYKLD